MARKHRVEVRLNCKEYRVLEEYADKFGITRSEAVRMLIHQLLELKIEELTKDNV